MTKGQWPPTNLNMGPRWVLDPPKFDVFLTIQISRSFLIIIEKAVCLGHIE